MKTTYGLNRSSTDPRCRGRRMVEDVYDKFGKYVKTILRGPFADDGLDEIRKAKWMKDGNRK